MTNDIFSQFQQIAQFFFLSLKHLNVNKIHIKFSLKLSQGILMIYILIFKHISGTKMFIQLIQNTNQFNHDCFELQYAGIRLKSIVVCVVLFFVR